VPANQRQDALSESNHAQKIRLPRAQRESQILTVALGLFISKGYQGTSMEDIAAAAGVTRPVIYKLFGVKDAIYLACLKQARQNLEQRLSHTSRSESTPHARLCAGIYGYFQFVEQDRAAWHLLFGGGAAVAGTVAGQATRLRFETARMIADLLEPNFPDVERSILEMHAHALSGAAEQLAKWWIENNHVERAHVVQILTSLMCRGFQQGNDVDACGMRRPKVTDQSSRTLNAWVDRLA
jgi:AcrR family transcriptional regulator